MLVSHLQARRSKQVQEAGLETRQAALKEVSQLAPRRCLPRAPAIPAER